MVIHHVHDCKAEYVQDVSAFLRILCMFDKGEFMGEFNQAKYIQQYQKENYDRCIFNVPKGQREKSESTMNKKDLKH